MSGVTPSADTFYAERRYADERRYERRARDDATMNTPSEAMTLAMRAAMPKIVSDERRAMPNRAMCRARCQQRQRSDATMMSDDAERYEKSMKAMRARY